MANVMIMTDSVSCLTEDIIKECKEELQISNLSMDQDTYNADDEGESKINIPVIHQYADDFDNESESKPKVSVIDREERPQNKKKRNRSVAKCQLFPFIGKEVEWGGRSEWHSLARH